MTSLPKTARGRATRQRIVEAAAQLMHVRGVSGTSVDAVLERADAGKSQFYHYFEDKEALVRVVLEHQMRESLRESMPVLTRLDTWDGIRAWFELVLERERERGFAGGCPVGSIAAELSEASAVVRRDVEEAFRIKGRYLLKGLEAMKEQGELRPEADPEALSEFVVATMQGGMLMGSTSKAERPLRNALEHAYRHLCSYKA